MPTLGVVVPTLNEALVLPTLVNRLLGAHAPRHHADRADHVVVADGGSDDETVAVAELAGAQVVHAERGRGRQLSAGARQLETDLYLFLHADCVPEPGALSALRTAFADDPSLLAAGCEQRVEAEGRFYRLVERAADRRVRRGMVFGDSGLCVRASTYREVGGFAEVSLFEDVDLSDRLAKLSAAARPRLVAGARLSVSARRWEREGPLRATFRNWMLRTRYRLGADPERLAGRYAPHSTP